MDHLGKTPNTKPEALLNLYRPQAGDEQKFLQRSKVRMAKRPSYSMKNLFLLSAQALAKVNQALRGDYYQAIAPKMMKKDPRDSFNREDEIFRETVKLLSKIKLPTRVRQALDSLEHAADTNRGLLKQQAESLESRRKYKTKKKPDFYLASALGIRTGYENLLNDHLKTSELRLIQDTFQAIVQTGFTDIKPGGLCVIVNENKEADAMANINNSMAARKVGDEADLEIGTMGSIERDFEVKGGFQGIRAAADFVNEFGLVKAIDFQEKEFQPKLGIKGEREADEIDAYLPLSKQTTTRAMENLHQAYFTLAVPIGFQVKELELLCKDENTAVDFSRATKDALNIIRFYDLNNCAGVKYRLERAEPAFMNDKELRERLLKAFPKKEDAQLEYAIFNSKNKSFEDKVAAILQDFKDNGAEYTSKYCNEFNTSENVFHQFDEKGAKGLCAELSLYLCNEFRRHGIASFISTAEFPSRRLQGSEAFIVDPTHARVGVLDEKGQVYIFDPSSIAHKFEHKENNVPENSSNPASDRADSQHPPSDHNQMIQNTDNQLGLGDRPQAHSDYFGGSTEWSVQARYPMRAAYKAFEMVDKLEKERIRSDNLLDSPLIDLMHRASLMVASLDILESTTEDRPNSLKSELFLNNFCKGKQGLKKVFLNDIEEAIKHRIRQAKPLSIKEFLELLKFTNNMNQSSAQALRVDKDNLYPSYQFDKVNSSLLKFFIASPEFDKMSETELWQFKALSANVFGISWPDGRTGILHGNNNHLKVINAISKSLQDRIEAGDDADWLKKELKNCFEAYDSHLLLDGNETLDIIDALKNILRQDSKNFEAKVLPLLQFAPRSENDEFSSYESSIWPSRIDKDPVEASVDSGLTLLKAMLADDELMQKGLGDYFDYDKARTHLRFKDSYQKIFEEQIDNLFVKQKTLSDTALAAITAFKRMGVDTLSVFDRFKPRELIKSIIEAGMDENCDSEDIASIKLAPFNEFNRSAGRPITYKNHSLSRDNVSINHFAKLLGFELDLFDLSDLDGLKQDQLGMAERLLSHYDYHLAELNSYGYRDFDRSRIEEARLAFSYGLRTRQKLHFINRQMPVIERLLNDADLTVKKAFAEKDSREIAISSNKVYPGFASKLESTLTTRRLIKERLEKGLIYSIMEKGFTYPGPANFMLSQLLSKSKGRVDNLKEELENLYESSDFKDENLTIKRIQLNKIFCDHFSDSSSDLAFVKTFLNPLSAKDLLLLGSLIKNLAPSKLLDVMEYYYDFTNKEELISNGEQRKTLFLSAKKNIPDSLVLKLENSIVDDASLGGVSDLKDDLANLASGLDIDKFKVHGMWRARAIKTIANEALSLKYPSVEEKDLSLRGGDSDIKFLTNRKVDGGTEFADSRAYVPGDSPARVNWAASARLDKLLVNQYLQPEARRRDYILDLAYLNYGKLYEGEASPGFKRVSRRLTAVFGTLLKNLKSRLPQTLSIAYHGHSLLNLNSDDLKKYLNASLINDELGKRTKLEDFMQDLLFLANKYKPHNYQVACPLISHGFNLDNGIDRKVVLITDNKDSILLTRAKMKDMYKKGFSFALGMAA